MGVGLGNGEHRGLGVGELAGQVQPLVRWLARGAYEHRGEVDSLIKRFSEHWRLERMPTVDRNILRLAIYELLYRPDIPAKVSINEAVDLGKKYGSEDSGSFINGILDRIRLHLEETGRRKPPPGNGPTLEPVGDIAG